MQLPTESKLIKNNIRDNDARGEILSIVDFKVSNVSIISCNKNTIRSNHYHLKDFHFMYVLEGKMEYFYKSLIKDEIKHFSVLSGDNIFTPNKEIHATFFPVFTKLIVSSGFPRDKKTYEEDTVRVNFLDNDNISEMMKKYAKNK
tara:strand:- start:2059 stop:2493 length:435 start_codon:yes stop_codon:yes gene_type:complete